MPVDVCLQGLRLDIFFCFGFDWNDTFLGLNGEVYLHFGFISGVIEGGYLDAGQLFVYVAFSEGSFEFFEDIVTHKHLGCRDFGHSAQQTDIQREDFEDIEIFIEAEWILYL